MQSLLEHVSLDSVVDGNTLLIYQCYSSDTNGMLSISGTYLESLLTLPAAISQNTNSTLTLQLGKLSLGTDFQTEMQKLNTSALAKGTSNRQRREYVRLNPHVTDEGYLIEGIKYFSEITIQTAVLYNIEISDETLALFAHQQAINSVGFNNETVAEPFIVSDVFLLFKAPTDVTPE